MGLTEAHRSRVVVWRVATSVVAAAYDAVGYSRALPDKRGPRNCQRPSSRYPNGQPLYSTSPLPSRYRNDHGSNTEFIKGESQ